MSRDASYLRAKNIMLSYTLPYDLTGRIGISAPRFLYPCMNLFEFSKIRKPLDPESIRTPTIEYPMQRIGTIGINLSF